MPSFIRDVPILDLREIPTRLFGAIGRVEVVRTVVLSSTNADAFMGVSREGVRSHLIIRPEEKLVIGQIPLTDEFLESLPDNSQCVILGHPFLDSFNIALFQSKVRTIRVYGQVLYSDRRLAGTLLSRLIRLQGQFLKTPPNALRWIGPRVLDGTVLKSIDGRGVVSIGRITIDPQVSAKDLTDHIPEITQIGEIVGTEETVSALMSLCKYRVGMYRVVESQAPPTVSALPSDASVGSPLVSIQGLPTSAAAGAAREHHAN